MLVAALALPATAFAGPANFAGDWTGSEGPIHLDQQGAKVTGTYHYANGRVSGDVRAGVLTGVWMQSTARYQCKYPQGGTSYWGRLQFTLAADGQSWKGLYSNCDDKLTMNWDEHRTGAAPSGPPSQPPVVPTGAEDPVADATWHVCAYPDAAEGCGDWRFLADGEVQGVSNGAVVWTGRWNELGHYAYSFAFTYMGQSAQEWVRFSDPGGAGHATRLLGYPDAAMAAPNRSGARVGG